MAPSLLYLDPCRSICVGGFRPCQYLMSVSRTFVATETDLSSGWKGVSTVRRWEIDEREPAAAKRDNSREGACLYDIEQGRWWCICRLRLATRCNVWRTRGRAGSKDPSSERGITPLVIHSKGLLIPGEVLNCRARNYFTFWMKIPKRTGWTLTFSNPSTHAVIVAKQREEDMNTGMVAPSQRFILNWRQAGYLSHACDYWTVQSSCW